MAELNVFDHTWAWSSLWEKQFQCGEWWMIRWKSKLLFTKGQTSRDDRLEVRTLDNRRHKTQGEAEAWGTWVLRWKETLKQSDWMCLKK